MKGRNIILSAATATLLFLAPASFAQEDSMPEVPAEEVLELRVNINTEDAETIAQVLDGVGLARAEAIVEYREENGPFASVEELIEVKGIGEHTLANNSERIRLE